MHILNKHTGDIEDVAKCLINGKITKVIPNRKIYINNNNTECLLSLDYFGNKKNWLLTGYKINKSGLGAKDKFLTTSNATDIRPTSYRSNTGAKPDINSITQNDRFFNPYTEALDNLNADLGGLDNDLKEQYILDLMDVFKNVEQLEPHQMKAIDLHHVKEMLYDMANYNQESGIRNQALKRIANTINQKLRNASPEYAKANDEFKLLKDIEQLYGGSVGVNPNTIAGKLMGYGDKNNVLSNLDERLLYLDNLLPLEDKFYYDAKELKKGMNRINNINAEIGNKNYERNPKLLANFNDTARENALKELQDMTRTNFMEDLENARAREVFERLTPGQGGGSGSAQGFANLYRNALTTSLAGSIGGLTGSVTGGLIGLLASSPKFMGAGTIKNLGALYRNANKDVPSWLIPLLMGTGNNLNGQ